MAKICVVHLVRECNGIEAFRSFIRSYQEKVAGVEHELLIAYKGFGDKTAVSPYQHLLKSPHQEIFLPDVGLDIGSYIAAAKHGHQEYFCFLNSFSSILEADWLEIMYRHITQDNIGVVSVTGSWESHLANHLELSKNLSPSISRFWLRRMASQQMRRHISGKIHRDFLPFPNYHVRTNAFMISRQLFLSLQHRKIRNKTEALKFESGRNGLTQQILQRGLRPVVVGRDGRAYDKEQWPQSQTFRTGNQENLLVADNQTRLYALADEVGKTDLYKRTWCRL